MLKTILWPLLVLFDPVDALPRAAVSKKWVLPLVLIIAMTAVAGGVTGFRTDAGRAVVAEMESSGELAKASEREIQEKTEQAQRVGIVSGVAKGVFGIPLLALSLATALLFVSWIVGRKIDFHTSFSVVVLALLPVALVKGVEIITVSRLPMLEPDALKALVPTSMASWAVLGSSKWARLVSAFDVVHLWVGVLVGIGYGAATKWSRARAIPFAMSLYGLFAVAASVGLSSAGPTGGAP
jgi:hypothetical protein